MKQAFRFWSWAVVFAGCWLAMSSAASAATDLLPDITISQNYLYDNDISTNTLPGRTVLRLSNGTANVGLGKLYLYGVLPSNGDGTQNVNQRIFRSDGTFYDRAAGRFIYHPTHNHIHVENWSIFRLRQILPNDGVGTIVATGAKTSFCILDLQIYNSALPNFNAAGEFTSCSSTIQGISVGWMDIYHKYLDGQYIDITDVAPGVYWLEAEVDPDNKVLESDETNNISRIKVTIGTPAPINADAYEPNNSIAAVNGRVEGSINSPNLGPCAPLKTINNLTIQGSTDPDFFKFILNSKGTAADSAKIFFQHSLGDVDMELLNANGVRVAISQGIVDNEKISLNGVAKGYYFLRVYGYNGASNPYYKLVIDPPSNGAPVVTPTAPPAGNVNVLHAIENYTVRWTYTDPDKDSCWVTIYVNSTPALNGNQIQLSTSINTPASLGMYNINTAELPLGKYYIYCEINDGGTVTGAWAPGTMTLVDNHIFGAVAGTITDQSAIPLSGARVELLNVGTVKFTDVNGKFQFDSLLSGTYTFGVTKAGYVDTTKTDVGVISPDTTKITVAMRLTPPPTAPISGTISDSAGTPISGATVTMLAPSQQTTSNGSGLYSFASLLSGTYSLTFTATGYYDSTIAGIVLNAPTAATVNVKMRKIPPPVGSITGTVTDSGGVALAGAQVKLLSPAQTTTANGSGQFSFSGLLSGNYSLTFSASGFIDSTMNNVVLNAPATTNLAVKLRHVVPTGTISGLVTDSNATPLVGVTVSIPLLSKTTSTNDSGRFSFAGIESGSYALGFSVTGYFDTTLTPVVMVAPAPTTTLMKMRHLPPPVGSIAGQVLRPGGDSIAGAVVTLLNPPATVTTGVNGRYSFANLLAGTYTISFSATGFVDTTKTGITHNPPATTTLNMVMRLPVGTISGLVTDTLGAPLSGVSIGLVNPPMTTTSASDGTFSFANLLSGSYAVTLTKTGYADTSRSSIVLNAPATTPVTIAMRQLPPVGAISGTVTNQSAVPILGVTVSIASPSVSTTTNGAGVYTLGGLLTGTYALTFHATGYYDTTIANVVMNAPATTSLSVAMRQLPPPVGSISGTVVNQSNAQLVGVAVQLVSPAQSTTTNSLGQFSFANLVSGLYSVRFSVAGYVDTTVSGITLVAPTSYTKTVIMRPVSTVPVADAYEPDNSLAETAGKVLGAYASPNLGPCGPLTVINNLSIHSTTSDYYQFVINATGTASDFVKISFLHSQGDLDMDLLSTTNNILGRSAGSTNSETISLNNLAKGTYQIRVYGYNSAKNPNYTLTIDPPGNGAPSIAATVPPVGNVDLVQGSGNCRVNWTFSDPESDRCWVTLYVNSSPVLDGNQLKINSIQNTDAALREAIIPTASLPLGRYYVYAEITDAGQKTGSWAPGTFTVVNGVATAPLTGTVRTASLATLAGASVTLVNPAMTTTSDANGRFSFAGLASGNYALKLSAQDHFDTTASGIVLGAPIATDVNLAMTPLPRETDDFNDNDAGNWSPVGGVWSVVSGALKGNGDNTDAVLRSPFALYGACDLTANMRWSIFLDRKARLIFSYIDANNYRFIEGDASNFRWRIGERVNGVNTIQASYIASTFAPDTWFAVRATIAANGLVTLRVNGAVVTSWQFASNVAGRIGVGYSRANADFDDVTVIGIPTGPAPQDGATTLADESAGQDDGLLQNYPNPFNPSTEISFRVPTSQHVSLTVYNVVGQVVRELVDGEISAGVHHVVWDGNSANGSPAASGVYFYQLRTEKVTQSKKMLLVK